MRGRGTLGRGRGLPPNQPETAYTFKPKEKDPAAIKEASYVKENASKEEEKQPVPVVKFQDPEPKFE